MELLQQKFRPGGHAEHSDFPAAETKPAGQAAQTIDAPEGVTKPAGQLLHEIAPNDTCDNNPPPLSVALSDA